MARWVVLALALSCTGGVVAHTTGWSLWDGEGSRFKTQPPSQKTPLEEYEESLRKGDSLCAAGNYFDAVLAYERAWRIAYNNKLKTDAAALDARLARAKNARDQGEEGEAVRFLELTVPQATSVRVARNSDYRPPQARVRRPGGLCLAGDGGVHRAGGASCRPCAQGGRQDARDDHLGLLSGRRGRTRQARRDDQQGCGVSASDLSSAGVIRVQCFAPPGMLPHSSPGAHSGW